MQPLKVNGPWKQGLYEISETAKEMVGTKREDRFGRVFRYAKAGATALAVGKQTIAATVNDDWDNCPVTVAAPVGSRTVSFTVVDVGTDALPADYFAGGTLQVNDGTGEGTWYPIVSSTAIPDDATVCTVTLEEPLAVALVATTSEVTPVPSPWMSTVISETITAPFPTGVPLVAVTAAYYYWSQTGGEGIYWADGVVPAIGTSLVLGADDGKLVPKTLDDYSATEDVIDTLMVVAVAYGRNTAVDTEYCPCFYKID